MTRPRLQKRPRLKRTYTIDEAAVLLKVDRSTVYRMLDDGRLKGVRQGAGGIRVDAGLLWAALRLGRVDRSRSHARANPGVRASTEDESEPVRQNPHG